MRAVRNSTMLAWMERLLKAYVLSSQQGLVHQSQPEAVSAGFTSVCILYRLQGCVWYYRWEA